MPIALNSDKALGQLQQVAQMAYGSGRTEKTDGGAGYIGLINGHVVKFATRSGERPFGGIKVTDDVKRSCDELRVTLGRLAKDALSKSVASDSSAAASLRRIYASLGLDSEGKVMDGLIGKKSLLSRKIVAKALNAIQEEVNRDGHHTVNVWEKAQRVTAADRHAQTEADTNFDTVAKIAEGGKVAAEVVKTLKTVQTPLDKKIEQILKHPEAKEHPEILEPLEALRTALRKARNAFADSIATDLAKVAVPGWKFRQDSEEDAAARVRILKAQNEFLKAVKKAFTDLSESTKDDPEVQNALNTALNVWEKAKYHTEDFDNLLESINGFYRFQSDVQTDYLSFFNTYFGLDVMQNIGLSNLS